MATDFTPAQARKIKLLRDSVRLQDPETVADPVYQYTDDDLWDILTLVTPAHSVLYTPDTIPDSEFYFALLLAKKEIYFRLATDTAPFYPLSAEGATLKKNVRFDHYMSLVRAVEKAYTTAKQELITGDGTIKSYDVSVLSHRYNLRDYALANVPTVALTIGTITQTTVECSWTKFSVPGGLFLHYKLFVSRTQIVDEYEETRVNERIQPVVSRWDINRTKYRAKELQPDTDYFATILSYDRNGLFGYDEKTFHTLP